MVKEERRIIRRGKHVEHVRPDLQMPCRMGARRFVPDAAHARLELADVGSGEEVFDGRFVGVPLRDGGVEVATEAVLVELRPVRWEFLGEECGDGDGA